MKMPSHANPSAYASTDVAVGVIIPNWNGADDLRNCLDSLLAQTHLPHIIIVDNGSTDGSVALVQEHYPQVEVIRRDRNYGYAGGVNPGFQLAIERQYDYVAPFNNDAIADKHWLERLVATLEHAPHYGIAACKLLSSNGHCLDSTGECYSIWGLPFPRGRGEEDVDRYDARTEIFGASGGASLYRVAMLSAIGLMDTDFFAYYEDIDLSFRAQLNGWRVIFVPTSRVYHKVGATGGRIKGFYTYQTIKNYPWLLWKNLPTRYLWRVLPRFALAHLLFIGRAIQRGHARYAFKALAVAIWLMPKKLGERHHIQRAKRAHGVSDEYIWSMLAHDLPPNAAALRQLRSYWHRLLP